MNFRAIQKLLSSCAFHPNKPGPMKVIVDVGNPDYYLDRAIEMIQESKSMPGDGRWVLRQRAISLLAINILKEQEQGGQSKPRAKNGTVQRNSTQAEPSHPEVPSKQADGSGPVGDRQGGQQDQEDASKRSPVMPTRQFVSEEPHRSNPLDEIANHES